MVSSSPKLVSILLNNYNYGRFLRDAIDSALAQTYPHCEVIVVDDGSTDDSRDIIASYGDHIVPVLKENGGQASAFNTGFEHSQGDILCFLDADDTFVPDKAQRLVNVLDQHAEAAWCFHPIQRVDSELNVLEWDESGWGTSELYDLRSLMTKGKFGDVTPFDCLLTSGMCFTRALLSKLLPMPTEIRITSDDYLKYAAMGTCRGYMLVEKLSLQRLHGNNAYTGQDQKQALQGKILLQTAYFLKRDFPTLSAFANNLYSLGLSKLARCQLEDPALDAINKAYAQSLPLLASLKVNAKKTYYQYLEK